MPAGGSSSTGSGVAPEIDSLERQRRWSSGSVEGRRAMAAVNSSVGWSGSASEQVQGATDTPSCDQTIESQPTDGRNLRTSMAVALDAIGGYGEDEATLPCARTIDGWLPCLASFVGPCCCCVRSHPDKVWVPLDLFTERVYHRPLAVVTFVSFTWQAFVAYFVALSGTNPTAFSLCAGNITEAVGFVQQRSNPVGIMLLGILISQTGYFGLVFATLIGAGNSRYEKRCWAWISPLVVALSFAATAPALDLCSREISQQGDDGPFSLYAGAVSNYVSAVFYAVQLCLSVLLLVRRRTSCNGSGDGEWCGPMEFSEPLPIRPLAPRNPTPQGALSSGLLADSTDVERHEQQEQFAAESGRVDRIDEPHRFNIPLRFWIALTLSATVVGFLAAMGGLYGVFLTDRLLAWAKSSNEQIGTAQAFLETLTGEDASVAYLISLLEGVSSSIDIIVDNFFAIRPALFTGMLLGLVNEASWKLVAYRDLVRFAKRAAEERVEVTSRFDFYWGFYFISFAAFNAAAAFLLVATFCTLLSFTIYAPLLRQQLWFTLLLSSSLGSLILGAIGRKVLFTGVVSTRNTLRYHRFFRWMDFAYSFTLGPFSAVASVVLRYCLLLLCSLSSLARIDQPLILPELRELGLDVWEPVFAAWGGMLKAHYHADLPGMHLRK
eukprot:COSAG02_NODE_9342_length_2250_cov_12.869363_1_plen_664_part_00